MENSAGKSGGAEISRKTRSLDIQSLYKSTVSKKERNNKRKIGVETDGEVRKKKKSRKEVLLSSFEQAGKKRSTLDKVYGDGVSSDLPDSERSQSGLSQKLDSSSGFNSISLNLDDSGNVIQIPKRCRDFVVHKKSESNQVSRPLGSLSSRVHGSVDQTVKLNGECKTLEGNQGLRRLWPPGGKASSTNQIAKLNDDSSGEVVSPKKVKGKLGFDDLKENRRGVSSAQLAKEEDGHLSVNSGDASSRKCRSNHRKRKNSASGGENLEKKVELLVDSSIKVCDDSQDDNEDNLEQNAARMLSSRFDPNCTGFSSKNRSSGSPSANDELSIFIHSDDDFGSRGANLLVGLESAYVDTANRVLRPRKQHKEKVFLRKRRHFYEILSRELDAYWVLNRRIKVFWPLDESWYYGLVSDYDPERKLHHIKYDDRDEEWINLQNERFKLLLLPSEVPRKTQPKRATMGKKYNDQEKRDLATDDDSIIGSYTDSEPIISWLARSYHRVKSSLVSKRHKTSHFSPNSVPLVLSTKTDGACGCLDMGSSERDMNKLSWNSMLSDRFIDTGRGDKSVLEGTSSSRNGKLPVVYVRRRFRKKDDGLFNAFEDGHGCGSAPVSIASVVEGFHASREYDISPGHMESEGLLWSVDNSGLLKLIIPVVEFKQFRFELGSPVPVQWYTFEAENSWLLRTVLLLNYGTVMITWPKVHLEMLFVDNIVGLRFLLFEGSLKQAVAFVSLVLTVFNQPNGQGKYVDAQMPVTSIRFKLSCVEDFRKQHVFAFYSFFKVKYSKWLYLDCKLKRHCLITKQLPLSECTYDSIKALEGGSNQLPISSSSRESSAFEGLWKKSMRSIMPMGAFRESCSVAMNQLSNLDAKHGKLLPFALSFAAAPTFFLSLHLKLLMENSVASSSLQDHDLIHSLEHSEKTGHPIANVSQLVTDTISECNDGGRVRSFQNFQNGKWNFARTSACSRDPGENASDVIVQSKKMECSSPELEQLVTLPQPLVANDQVSVGMSDARYYSGLTGLRVEIPSLDQVERSVVGKTPTSTQSDDMAWNMSYSIVHSPNPTGPTSMGNHNRNSSSSSFGDVFHAWPDGKADFMRNGFGNGPKKPRTQVQYTLPSGGLDFNSKHKMHNQRRLPYQRIRKANEKRASDGSRNSRRNLELLSCDANVLITIWDRGWRECGARVVLELADHNEWRLAVKLSGTTKYSYKAHQFLQPGSTNRYTHAMVWKGGKDWVLEFPDRSQWMLFKEMHEECYNRNVRAASVKNIPIPGVHLIEESDDNGTEVLFVRSSPKYFRQIETDVDMAMDPSHILYDMDSDDEQWISENQKSLCGQGSQCEEVSEEFFEKTMHMFEKVAYAHKCDHFTSEEIEEFMAGVGPVEAIKIIYKHWQLKRQMKRMPLIRHLQPPLWEWYEQQVKEWEQAMTKANRALSNGCQEKALPMDKPPMFAFCLKPRGLETQNKGSKHRSHRRFPVSGHNHTSPGDQDGFHAVGRRLNGFAFGGDEKVMFQGYSHEPSDASPSFQASRSFTPRDSGFGNFSLSSDWSEWNHHPKLHRNKSKKIGTFLPPNNSLMVASYNQRTTIGKKNGVHRWNMGLPEWPSQKHYQSEISLGHGIELLDGSDLDEFRLRDASGAAQHALNMAKLKREKAQRLLYRADLAIHKAVVALMTADTIRASFEHSNGDG
ncbi:uncharacterized protein LOC114310990 [Camellia sinensis]|uniref:Enhancer of polycomb-like protein n=1 Tax=Camellia sinensis var. sinensis TaxID=542762 RepID=A0A4S4DEQ8_CAMSN|nr:uncharacterized protein LOC114310990 [Camellia sinensis]THG01169.1 hypothetical protein TEA_015882 [Camellia sinensis var. sinensis]